MEYKSPIYHFSSRLALFVLWWNIFISIDTKLFQFHDQNLMSMGQRISKYSQLILRCKSIDIFLWGPEIPISGRQLNVLDSEINYKGGIKQFYTIMEVLIWRMLRMQTFGTQILENARRLHNLNMTSFNVCNLKVSLITRSHIIFITVTT